MQIDCCPVWYTVQYQYYESVVPEMGGKKKATSAKSWTLAGEPVYFSALSPAEERIFTETVSHFREIASRMREDFDRFSGAVAAARAGQQASRASVGFFCKYYEGKYQRADIVKALATAAMLPAPSAEHLGKSPVFMLGAALWLLDYVKRQELEEQFYPLLPEKLDEEVDFETPDVDDLDHSRDEILGVMSVFLNRKDSRRAFRKLWGLVDKETAGKLKGEFKDALLDYFERFLEISTRMLPGVRFFDREMLPDISIIKSADVVWIQASWLWISSTNSSWRRWMQWLSVSESHRYSLSAVISATQRDGLCAAVWPLCYPEGNKPPLTADAAVSKACGRCVPSGEISTTESGR